MATTKLKLIAPNQKENDASFGPAMWAFEPSVNYGWANATKVFSAEECEKIIKLGSKHKPKAGYIKDENTAKVNISVRDSQVCFLQPNQDTEWIYRRLVDISKHLNEKYFNFDVFGFTEGLQFTKYIAPGGCYKTHIDVLPNGPVRKLSISIQLSDPSTYEGGDLELHNSSTGEQMSKEQGTLVMFPSYTLHQVKPVTKGTRYSLVAWISGTPFK